MAEVRTGENESIDSALRRCKQKIQKAGILSYLGRRERYEKPSLGPQGARGSSPQGHWLK